MVCLHTASCPWRLFFLISQLMRDLVLVARTVTIYKAFFIATHSLALGSASARPQDSVHDECTIRIRPTRDIPRTKSYRKGCGQTSAHRPKPRYIHMYAQVGILAPYISSNFNGSSHTLPHSPPADCLTAGPSTLTSCLNMNILYNTTQSTSSCLQARCRRSRRDVPALPKSKQPDDIEYLMNVIW